MKRTLFFTICAFVFGAFTSCNSEFPEQDWSTPALDGIILSCNVATTDEDPMTWPATTQIGFYCAQTESVNVPLTISASSSGTETAGFNTGIKWANGEHDIFVYYPYESTSGESSIAGNLSNTIASSGDKASLNKQNVYIGTAKCTPEASVGGAEISMIPLFDFCKISLSNTKYAEHDLDKVYLKSNSGKPLCGKWSYDIASSTVTFTEAVDNITINVSNTTLSNVTEDIYFLSYACNALNEECEVEITLAKGQGNVVLQGTVNLTASTTIDLDALKSTAIEDNSINLADLDNDGLIETANCYVAGKHNKTYRFPATVMGNGKALAADNDYTPTAAGSAPGITPTTLSPKSAQVLWQTGSSLITGVKLNNGYVYFNLNGDANGGFIPGNAVIAVYSGDNCTGVILWSWHIWITDADLDSKLQTWKVNSLLSSYSAYQNPQLMDRNLGALSSSDWASSNTNMSKGLNYQWGRKDPFVGPDNSSMTSRVAIQTYDATGKAITNTVAAASTFSNAAAWTHVARQITREDIAKYPMAYVSGASNYFWLTETAHDLWGCPGYEDSKNTIGQKTIYDPCPPGYRVMNGYAMSGVTSTVAGGALANLTHSVQNVATYRTYGEDLKVKCNDTDFATIPASGLIYFEKAQNYFPFDRTGTYGYIWTAKMTSNSKDRAFRVHFDWNNFVAMEAAYASYGHNVRCEKIK